MYRCKKKGIFKVSAFLLSESNFFLAGGFVRASVVLTAYATRIRIRVSVSEGYGYADTAFSQKNPIRICFEFLCKKINNMHIN